MAPDPLEAPPGVPLPDLGALPGVARVVPESTEALDAVHLDTTDLRLLRAGITLRRRTGGHDEGWHLELPAGDAGHLEVHRPLGTQARVVPESLLALVSARVRGAALDPVARFGTTRARLALYSPAGERLAGVTDDTVTAEAYAEPAGIAALEAEESPETAEKGGDTTELLRWREIEVELDRGDPALLTATREALLASVVSEAPAGSRLARVLADRLEIHAVPARRPDGPAAHVVAAVAREVERLLELDPRVRLNAEGAVAELRTTVRRLLALLAVFGPLMGGDSVTAPPGRGLARLRDRLDRARDAAALHAALLAELDALPPELVIGPVRRRVDSELQQEQRQAHVALVRELNSPQHRDLLEALDRAAAPPPAADRPAKRKQVVAVLAPLVAEAHARGDVAEAAVAARTLAGIARKRAAEQADAYAAAAGELLAAQARLRDDALLRSGLLGLVGRATQAGENGFTYGRVHAEVDHRAPAVAAAHRSARERLEAVVADRW